MYIEKFFKTSFLQNPPVEIFLESIAREVQSKWIDTAVEKSKAET